MKSSVCANGVSARMIFRKRDGEDELTAVHVPADSSSTDDSQADADSSESQETVTATAEQTAATSEASS